jgi:ABC-type branched-subunit amino acid transport system ATPase component/SAM-dependent methyltransferase
MRITRLNLEAGAGMGLKPDIMTPLGNLVVLAGPNGAGKSRILTTVRDLLSDSSIHSPQVDIYKAALVNHENAIKTGSSLYNEHQIVQFRENVQRSAFATLDQPNKENSVLDFFPKIAALSDYRNLNEAGQAEAVRKATEMGLKKFEDRALAYVAAIEKRWFAATHPDMKFSPDEATLAITERERLGNLINDVLGTRPQLNLNLQPTLFGRPIPEAKLSEGQGILLQVAVALHAQGSALNGLVLLLDEPECHLHPAAIIQAIQKLRQANEAGQIWLATHSVTVLAALPTESIWYVSNSGVSWAGRRPEIVLEGLLGGPEGREQVEEFLRLPAQFASNRFAAECLIRPRALDSAADDPQSGQVREFCKTVAVSEENPLKVLDFGAGQGRLLSSMYERWDGSRPFSAAVDYRAYEPFPEDPKRLGEIVSNIYSGDGTSRVLTFPSELAKIDDASVDVIVMCNVLHEIPPEEWKILLGANGQITNLLSHNGHLLVLEDTEMPHGEKAHRFGFLLLDEIHLYKLMCCKEADVEKIRTVTVRSGRLKAHVIPAHLLGRTTRESTIEALKGLLDTARGEIKRLREKDVGSRNGRLHALWTQLLANADLGIQALE